MTDKIETPALASNPGPDESKQTNNNTRQTKWRRVLAALVAGRSYNRFQAERELNDHCLHSTVSELQRMGITIHRRFETVPGFMGCPTEVCRYWLASESVERARKLLEGSTPPKPLRANLSLSDSTTGV